MKNILGLANMNKIMMSYQSLKYRQIGFTLIELMVVVSIIAALAVIAVPSYQQYTRNAAMAAAQQEMLKLADQLERHRGKNFTYRGFNPGYLYNQSGVVTSVTLPVGATGSSIQYTLTLKDTSESTVKPLAEPPLAPSGTTTLGLGRQWAIRGERNQTNGIVRDKGYNILLTSSGERCMTTLAISAVTDLNNYTGCSTSAEKW